jgi:hypothetical protein
MYGIVNKAIEELISENYGIEKWTTIRKASGVEVEFFLSNEAYDDEVTYKLANSAARELNLTVDEVLEAFGEWWILRTSQEKYGKLMHAGGRNLREFLINLPNFHNRISLIYPKLAPPEFKVTDQTDSTLNLHYYSGRPGLKNFVRGLVVGLGKMYKEEINIELLTCRESGSDHEIFKISWI